MLDVVFLVVREDQDVIKVDDNKLVHDILEDVIDKVLEAGGRIHETETHDEGLEKTLGRGEGGFPFIPLPDPDVVVTPSDVKLGEDAGSFELVDDVGSERQGVPVLHCKLVKLAIILYEA